MSGVLDIEQFRSLLGLIYGPDAASEWESRLVQLADEFRLKHSFRNLSPLSEKDVILITYADQFQEVGAAPLQSLLTFFKKNLEEFISGIHILPFFPFTSDDGFSVSDYDQVNPVFGSWQDILRIGQESRLMVDAVLNHCSSRHRWFERYLAGDPHYANYFIAVDASSDLSRVVRPRALPLLTTFESFNGPRHVWTTFSPDQIDLNFAEPAVLFEGIRILLNYIDHGAQIIRLDAIAYLWKEIGTTCIHRPQVHWMIQLMRLLLDWAAPGVQLITETNVPHIDNISYFGDGANEAGMVYNFALPPLVLHSLYQGSASQLTNWAASLKAPSDQTAFFNFLASHDGIGLNPVRGILSDNDFDALVNGCYARGGLVSYKSNSDGSQTPYELNINYFDAAGDPSGLLGSDLHSKRLLTAHALLFSLAGMPGIYVHSLLGSRGWPEGAKYTGHKRTINRQKFSLPELQAELDDRNTLRNRVFFGMKKLLMTRRKFPQLSPFAGQEVVKIKPELFTVVRHCTGMAPLVCVLNFSQDKQSFPGLALREYLGGSWQDVLNGSEFGSTSQTIGLSPYQTRWLTVEGEMNDSAKIR